MEIFFMAILVCIISVMFYFFKDLLDRNEKTNQEYRKSCDFYFNEMKGFYLPVYNPQVIIKGKEGEVAAVNRVNEAGPVTPEEKRLDELSMAEQKLLQKDIIGAEDEKALDIISNERKNIMERLNNVN